MKWSFKLGRLLGIDVYIHYTFLLLLGLIGLSQALRGGGLPAAVTGMIFFLCLFGCVLLHEYGHALMARRYGIPTRDITLLPIGGVARLERMPDKPAQELWVALAGPAVNVLIAAGLGAWLLLANSGQRVSLLDTTGGSLPERLLAVNLLLVIFNLLPAFPMDGGRVLRALLAMRMPYVRATRIAARIGQTMALLFALAGLFASPLLLFIALFVWFGAAQENAAVAMRASFDGVRVREAMVTDFHSLAPHQTLADAARRLLAGSQPDFPVTHNGQIVGVLAHTRLMELLREGRLQTLVGDVMETSFPTSSAEEALDAALGRFELGQTSLVPVIANRQLVGLLTAENLAEFHVIHRARMEEARRRPPPPPVIGWPRVLPPPPWSAGAKC